MLLSDCDLLWSVLAIVIARSLLVAEKCRYPHWGKSQMKSEDEYVVTWRMTSTLALVLTLLYHLLPSQNG